MFMRESCLILFLGCASSLAHATDTVIISEYVEGSGNNKAIELYNVSDTVVELSDYQIHFYFNGNSDPASNITLQGSLETGHVFVLSDNDASEAILSIADMTSSMSFFNGDDAIVLSYQGEVVDSLGQVGSDPGVEWGSGLVSTKDNTLRRNAEQLISDTIVDDEVTLVNWLGFEKDDISDLGVFGGDTPTEPEPSEPLVCHDPAMAISDIQGEALASEYIGQQVVLEAIVVSNNETGFDGFFVQSPDSESDDNPLTSEGVFVYTADNSLGFELGDRVRLQGTVEEFNSLTQIAAISQSLLCDTAQSLPSSTLLVLPRVDDREFEAVEGMRVHFSQNLTVNEVYNLGRFGEILLGSERHFIGTQVAQPGEDALAISEQNSNDAIILDDGLTSQNPDNIRFPAPALSAENTVRVGDTVTELTAIMHYGFGAYRLLPTQIVNFIATNERTVSPLLPESRDVVLASFNVLNFFNGDGLGGGFPTARGADDLIEFERQQLKIVEAMLAIDADVVGLMEIENDGFGEHSAIAVLVDALNQQRGEERYDFIASSTGSLGTDDIAVGLIYRADKVVPNGDALVLSSENSPLDETGVPLFNDDKNRPMLTQLFAVLGSENERRKGQSQMGEGKMIPAANDLSQFVVAVNHFKSKGSSCSSIGDPDLDDGQGNCNVTRTRAALAAAQWLNTTYPAQGVLLMGDLNAYAKEDPLSAFDAAGFHELFEYFDKEGMYTYVYSGESGQLDHVLANAVLLDNVIDVTQWHINTDEPRVLDYNLEFKSDTQQDTLYAGDAYRSSDHDPVLVSLQFDTPNIAPTASFELSQNNGLVTFVSTSSDVDGEIVRYQWDFGDGSGADRAEVSHEYTQNGDYTIILIVTDDGGLTQSHAETIHVLLEPEGHAPVAIIKHQAWRFIHLFTSMSVDEDGTIERQMWHFDDGYFSSLPWVVRFGHQGSHVELIVEDNDGLQGSVTLDY
ncbi:ExeM/NucH family extracellular endonuclease [Shewanella surugensis]|uniref:ExeM/NucH family extracellular endonuclease n=1 Tax=Shewanella surugensis TaxID=212020 RepID=A0ABT0LHA2_9GAMM|nr:ExeM/NucH family extracellular endonuclease [Shewanella surugensis]MCL1127073.1 ExeM/NucH family extracellular endonuclease [Shewanella surugensis]